MNGNFKWIIGLIISTILGISAWQITLNVRQSAAAQQSAGEALMMSNRNAVKIDDLEKNINKQLETLEKHQAERHEQVLKAIDEVKKDIKK